MGNVRYRVTSCLSYMAMKLVPKCVKFTYKFVKKNLNREVPVFSPYRSSQLTVFYMRVTLALNELNTLPWTLGLKREYITEEVCINTPWIQDVYWTYIRRSGDAQDVQLKIIPFFLICSGSPSGSFSWVRFGTLTILKVKFKSYSWTFC